MFRMQNVAVVYLLFYVRLSFAQTYRNGLISPFRLVAFSNDTVYLAGEGGIVALHRKNLSEFNSNTTYQNNWLLLYDEEKLIQCNEDITNISYCRIISSDLKDIIHTSTKITANITSLPTYTKTHIPAYDEDIVAIGATSLKIFNVSYGLASLEIDNLELFNTTPYEKGPMNIELGEESTLIFKSSFQHESFVYFIFQVVSDNNKISGRLGKLCKNTGTHTNIFGYKHSYEDLKLKCKYNSSVVEEVNYGVRNGQVFVAAFSRGDTSIICIYRWNDIQTKYVESRKRLFECNTNLSKSERYFEPVISVGNGHEYCVQNGICDKEHLFCAEVNGTFCNTYFHHTVTNGEDLQSDSEYEIKKKITSLNIRSLEVGFLLYFGTEDGQVGMVYFHEEYKVEGRSILKEVSQSKVIKIIPQDMMLYVLTQKELVNIEFSNCSEYTNCSSCMESDNIFCGWDLIEKECRINTKRSKTLWIPSHLGACIEVSVTPLSVFLKDGVNDFEFKWNVTLIPAANITACTLQGYSVKPIVKQNPVCTFKEKEFKSGNSTFSLQLNNVSVAVKRIELYFCSYFNNCIDCTRKEQCGWSIDQAKCVDFSFSFAKEELCPRLKPEDRHRKVPVTTSPINVTFNLDGFNLKDISLKWTCAITDGVEKVHVAEALLNENGTFVTCLTLNFTRDGTFNIRLRYNETLAEGDALIEVYECNNLTKSCVECKNLLTNGYQCEWCHADQICFSKETENCTSVVTPNCIPVIHQVFPVSGPVNGGTKITITGNSIGNTEDHIVVNISDIPCTSVEVLENSVKLSCVTGSATNAAVDNEISISVNGSKFDTSSNAYFTYKKPEGPYEFFPNNGTLSGGKTITITGKNIGFQGQNRYSISICNDGGILCIDCRIVSDPNENKISCKNSNITEPQNMTYLFMQIDTLTNITINENFYYLPDPSVEIPDGPLPSLNSGGATISIHGNGFENVGEVIIERVEKPCDKSNILVVCNTPPRKSNSSGTANETVNVYFDGLRKEITLQYVADPSFEKFSGILEYEDKESTIEITGKHILTGVKQDDYTIHVGLTGTCFIHDINTEIIRCFPPKSVPRTNKTNKNIVFVVVEVGRIEEYIGDMRYTEETEELEILVGVLATLLVVAVVIGVVVALVLKRKKKKTIKAFKMELLSREEMIRKASREEFADAQMTIRDIKSDLVTTKVPYCDYQRYVFHQLFPNQDIKTHPLLFASRITDDSKVKMQSAMDILDQLLTNKIFLKSLVQSLDKRNKLTLQEKAHFASVISIALIGNMRLFFDLVTCLLTETIRDTSRKQHKILFRRCESISQRLLAHWLQIILYAQLKSQSGLQLFMLFKAVQTVIEKGPVDALTNNSRNTLAEEKLLKMRVEYEPLTLQIDLNGNSDQHYPVKVLDCDTISQVKQKCVAQIYKNKPVSEVPHNDELTLEWRIGKGGKHILQDIDSINDRNNDLVRLNTLKHYMVKDNSQMALMYKEHIVEDVYENQIHREDSLAADDINLIVTGDEGEQADTLKWHLECCTSNLPDDEKSNREQDIGDIFLNRLFHTKLLLSDYIDIAFEGLVEPQSLSVPIRYFLCMLNKLGKEHDIDPEVIRIWKSECYATRLWGPLIGKPQILFDVDMPAHVQPCMDILKQVFVESFTQATHKVSKESPPQKLLFHKDIPQYRKRIDPFFIRVEPVEDQAFWSSLNEISNSQKNEMKFSRQATLQQLYNLFIAKYRTEIIDDFNDMEESKDLGFGTKLEELIELMEESATDS